MGPSISYLALGGPHDIGSCPSLVDERYWFPTQCRDFQIVAIFMKPAVE